MASPLLQLTEIEKYEWCFEYPRLSYDVVKQLDYALDCWDAVSIIKSEQILQQLRYEYPEFIDAHHHVALILSRRGDHEQAFEVWKQAVEIGLSAFPSNFCIGRDLLPWCNLENRPFLRAYHALGLHYFDQSLIGEALSIFNNILDMNPDDNQGIRSLAINCLFHLQRPLDVLKICDIYTDCIDEYVLYGRVLALYQLGRQEEAKNALFEAKQHFPLIGKEIAKRRHTQPKNMNSMTITQYSANQAFAYWQYHKYIWERVEGALDFVRTEIKGKV